MEQIMSDVKSVGFFVNGKNLKSKTKEFYDIYDPNIGEVIAKANLDNEFDVGSRVQFPDLDESALANLQILGRIWGFLKYYHPEISNGNIDWDSTLIVFIKKMETIKNNDSII